MSEDGDDAYKIDLTQFLQDYLADAREGFQEAFDALLALDREPERAEFLDEVFRVMHTLKSSSTMLEFTEIAEAAHMTEDLLDGLKSHMPLEKETVDLLIEAVEKIEGMVRLRAHGKADESAFRDVADRMRGIVSIGLPPGERHRVPEGVRPGKSAATRRAADISLEKVATVRVHTNLLDNLFNMVGELIITKNRIDNIVQDIERKDLKTAISDMRRIIDVLQENVSVARMVPVDEIFQKFPRMVRELARERGRDVDLLVEGNEIEIDKALIDAIGEPLIHMLRNAVDHGIEPPDERLRLGKEGRGSIRLAASRTESHILIDVEDDGCGIDAANIKSLAVEKGFVSHEDANSMRERDALNLLFRPGFSSVSNVTDVSGRGVGLDVVLTSARKMGGLVEIATKPGKGTRFTLKLPLTTSIIQTLMVASGGSVFAIPSDMVLETTDISPGDIKEVGGDRVMNMAGRVIPFMRLDSLLNARNITGGISGSVVIIQMDDRLVALGVDEVLNQMENIIKPFDPIARNFRGFSGGIIMGDGRVALLLDVPSLIHVDALRAEGF
ncbi:MAG: chemotaxis protein CheA [Nitrospirae bacterium]|nr:chemotaxis protein CheA [Nitrospirota bacterium]